MLRTNMIVLVPVDLHKDWNLWSWTECNFKICMLFGLQDTKLIEKQIIYGIVKDWKVYVPEEIFKGGWSWVPRELLTSSCFYLYRWEFFCISFNSSTIIFALSTKRELRFPSQFIPINCAVWFSCLEVFNCYRSITRIYSPSHSSPSWLTTLHLVQLSVW